MGPVDMQYKPVSRPCLIREVQTADVASYQLPRRELSMDTDDSAFTEDTMDETEDSAVDDAAPVLGDLTPDSDAMDASYIETEHNTASALLNMGLDSASQAEMDTEGANFPSRGSALDDADSVSDESKADSVADSDVSAESDAGEAPTSGDAQTATSMDVDPTEEPAEAAENEDIAEPPVSADNEMGDETTAYSGSPFASFVSLEDTLVGSTEDLRSYVLDVKMDDVSDIEDVEAIAVDEAEDSMIITSTPSSDVDMAETPRPRKFKLTTALKRVLAPAVAAPKKILVDLASKRVFTPYNSLRSGSRRNNARISGDPPFPYAR